MAIEGIQFSQRELQRNKIETQALDFRGEKKQKNVLALFCVLFVDSSVCSKLVKLRFSFLFNRRFFC